MPYKWCLQEHKENGDLVGTNVSNSFPSRGCLFMVLQIDPYNQIEKSISFQANYFPSDKLLRFMTLLYSLELILVWKIKSIVQGGDIRLYQCPSINLYRFLLCYWFCQAFNLHLPNAWTNLNRQMNLFIWVGLSNLQGFIPKKIHLLKWWNVTSSCHFLPSWVWGTHIGVKNCT
jgi:hypothetical protein